MFVFVIYNHNFSASKSQRGFLVQKMRSVHLQLEARIQMFRKSWSRIQNHQMEKQLKLGIFRIKKLKWREYDVQDASPEGKQLIKKLKISFKKGIKRNWNNSLFSNKQIGTTLVLVITFVICPVVAQSSCVVIWPFLNVSKRLKRWIIMLARNQMVFFTSWCNNKKIPIFKTECWP